ncbi:hypothetical protein CSKR_113009 [Clonorchis sinensis]|uniref:Uncharacterized protein n=1 Tax=Clonorchis sinensis TaxID=79923 RepID=A0A419PUT8_CLOSI|nr:hypothetical protein CSKR_113009 [Clonorchis sinensis]
MALSVHQRRMVLSVQCGRDWELRIEGGGFDARLLSVARHSHIYDGHYPMVHQYLHSHGGARWPKWLERESTDRKVRGSNPTSASRLPLSRLGQPGSISALVLPSGGMAARHRKGVLQLSDFFSQSWSSHQNPLPPLREHDGANLLTGRPVVRIQPRDHDCSCLHLSILTVSQFSRF